MADAVDLDNDVPLFPNAFIDIDDAAVPTSVEMRREKNRSVAVTIVDAARYAHLSCSLKCPLI